MREQWMGQKGFDEAQYYNGETDHLESGEENDSVIRAKVLEAFRRNPKLCAAEVEVTVHDGFVTLEGRIPGIQEKKEASDAIQTLSGVKVVRNLLAIEN